MQKWRASIVAGALVIAHIFGVDTLSFAQGSPSSPNPQTSVNHRSSQAALPSKTPDTASVAAAARTHATIQGSARTSTDLPMVGATVRLRDARRGQIVA